MSTDMRGCRPGEENNRNTTLNTRSKGRNVARRKHCKSDSEAQQIPGEVPNYVSLDLCSGEPSHYSDAANHSVGPSGSSDNVELPAGCVELPAVNV